MQKEFTSQWRGTPLISSTSMAGNVASPFTCAAIARRISSPGPSTLDYLHGNDILKSFCLQRMITEIGLFNMAADITTAKPYTLYFLWNSNELARL